MTESQAHGFIFQDALFIDIYGATKDELRAISYTAKLDLPGELNRLDPGIPVSCKVTGNANKVDMGDCLRIYDGVSSGAPYHLLVAAYTQDDATNTKTITSIVEVDLTSATEALFGTLTRDEIAALDAVIKAVPHGRAPTASERDGVYYFRDELHAKTGALQLAPKMDSKAQRRLQCSFGHFQRFIAANPHRVVAQGTPAAFRDHALSVSVIASGRRVRHAAAAVTTATSP
jgi:hypothetical protein